MFCFGGDSLDVLHLKVIANRLVLNFELHVTSVSVVC